MKRPVRLTCPCCYTTEVVERDRVGEWIETHDCPPDSPPKTSRAAPDSA
jgi:hypothetical protein